MTGIRGSFRFLILFPFDAAGTVLGGIQKTILRKAAATAFDFHHPPAPKAVPRKERV